MSFTIGSLFDGSGGFPLAAFLCGGTPLWASEVEPYPIAVTKTRFPHMKHLGSVTEVKGDEVEPVDVITFGSPCQDLSIAGKRAGLKHEGNGDEETTRSGLFMEAVRIIREMREATNGVYPRFAVWENVPGAFSSNKGEDFRIVLEELIKIVEAEAEMPPVPEGGWPYADCYLGDGWSLAYRVFDAQYWGVPQRRRRIYLVLDLGGQCAGKVSFEREGLRGYFAEGRTPWEAAPGDAERSSGAADCEGNCLGFDMYNQQSTGDVSRTLKMPVGGDDLPVVCYSLEPGIAAREGVGLDIYNLAVTGDTAASLTTATGQGASNTGPSVMVPYLLKIRSGCEGGGKGALIQTDMSATLSTLNDQYLFQPVVSAGFCTEHSANARGIGYQEEVAPTLRAGVTPAVVYSIENHPADSRVDIDTSGKVQTLTGRMGTGGGNVPMVMEQSVCIPIHDKATRYQGGGPTRNGDGAGNGLGVGADGDPTPTLSTCDRHIVCYGIGNGQANQSFLEECVGTLNCMHDQQAVCYGVDCRNATEYPEMTGCLQHDCYKNLNSNGVVRVRYIVRRLTPTECARLQGFADGWGHPDTKTEFTDEEYEFWLNVRNTHAEINGKTVKSYTTDQMLNWYNKLHTDSSEYKLWGNGIALPCALYVMQGIAEVFFSERG